MKTLESKFLHWCISLVWDINNIFKSPETIEADLQDIKDVLFLYDTGNAEVFSQQISAIDDKQDLIQLRRALELYKELFNVLSQKEFAGQIRPRVEVRTIRLEGHEVDVFIIKNSTDVPYYLTESYTDKKYKPDPPKKGKTVQAFHIYTRVMDNNTPIDKSADIRDVEYLWKKRFGLLQTPLEQVKILLRKPDEWAEEDSRYYHKLFPQYISIAI